MKSRCIDAKQNTDGYNKHGSTFPGRLPVRRSSAKHRVLGSVSRDFDAGTPIAHGRNRQSDDTLIILLGLAGLEQVSGKTKFF